MAGQEQRKDRGGSEKQERIYGENGKSNSYERTWWPRSERLFLIFIALVEK
jgi:hypothetical protein